MSLQFQSMLQHKVQRQHRKTKRLCRDREVFCHDKHNIRLRLNYIAPWEVIVMTNVEKNYRKNVVTQ